MPKETKIAVMGFGAIGRPVAEKLAQGGIGNARLAGVLVRSARASSGAVSFHTDLDGILALSPDLIVEAVGAEGFSAFVPRCLAAGIDVLAVSVAAMADIEVEQKVRAAMAEGKSRLHVASGGVGGLDALSAAGEGGLTHVELVQRKPPKAFPDMDQSIAIATTVSSGSAREAALAFPRNSNIAAAIALAGIGFDKTRVTVVADPAVSSNMAELVVTGAFGELRLAMRNNPSPLNAATSQLASLSVLWALRRMTSSPIVVPA